ncbi:MAG TPA: cytochrome C oxidase subunit II [Deltaproteobacteria bacterium]|nr:cytochrome C oxidase subunit II [Deltaproteobacteria bacterium]
MIGLVNVLAGVIIIGIFWKVGMSAKEREDDYTKVTKKGYAIRSKYFWSLLAVSIVLFIVGIIAFPYPDIMEAKISGDPEIVKVEAFQFGWVLDKDELPLGRPVRFDVTANDVNHGFGIYYHGKDGNRRKGVFVAQTQAMPDYINKLYVTFDKPGIYKIWCLEYCGVAHHIMVGEFEVKEEV